MEPVIVVLILAGLACLLLSRVWRTRFAERSRPTISAAEIDAIAQRVIAEQGLADDVQEAETDASIADFKSTLQRWPVTAAEGRTVRLWYDGEDGAAREVRIDAVFAGPRDSYLDCWWPARNDARLFRLGEVERVEDRGERFEPGWRWLARQGEAGAALADRFGWRA